MKARLKGKDAVLGVLLAGWPVFVIVAVAAALFYDSTVPVPPQPPLTTPELIHRLVLADDSGFNFFCHTRSGRKAGRAYDHVCEYTTTRGWVCSVGTGLVTRRFFLDVHGDDYDEIAQRVIKATRCEVAF